MRKAMTLEDALERVLDAVDFEINCYQDNPDTDEPIRELLRASKKVETVIRLAVSGGVLGKMKESRK